MNGKDFTFWLKDLVGLGGGDVPTAPTSAPVAPPLAPLPAGEWQALDLPLNVDCTFFGRQFARTFTHFRLNQNGELTFLLDKAVNVTNNLDVSVRQEAVFSLSSGKSAFVIENGVVYVFKRKLGICELQFQADGIPTYLESTVERRDRHGKLRIG